MLQGSVLPCRKAQRKQGEPRLMASPLCEVVRLPKRGIEIADRLPLSV